MNAQLPHGHSSSKEHLMRLIQASYVSGIVAAIALTVASADAHSRHSSGARSAPHAYDDGSYAYVGDPAPAMGTFSYGARRAPYGWNKDYPLDFQLQGHN